MLLVTLQHLVQRRAAQVGVHDQHALAALGKDRGQIEDGGGLAFAGAGADDGDGVELVVLAREQQVGAQHAVGLGVRAFGAFLEQQADVLRNDAQHRRLQRALDVVDGLHAGVEILDEEGQADADHQADDDAQGDVEAACWGAPGACPDWPCRRSPPWWSWAGPRRSSRVDLHG